MAAPNVSNSQIVKQLTTSWESAPGVSRSWAGSTVNFSIADDAPTFNMGEGFGFQTMTANEKSLARLAFRQWDELSNLHLNEVSDRNAEITFAYSSTTWDDGTYTFSNPAIPRDLGGSASQNLTFSQIWIDSGWDTNQDSAMKVGSYGFMTYMHEIGHAIGLSHPGVYNASDAENPTYADDAQYSRDTHQYTIMSYFNEGEDGSGARWKGAEAATPMVDDIMAIQAKYGANMSTRSGSTVYGFNSNITGVDNAIYDFSRNTAPVYSIWDGGGVDTIDASGFSDDQRIDLVAGHYSDVGGLKQNIGIARSVTIENAIGGSGNDTLTGNSVANRLEGGGGADNLNGGAAFDTLIGGSGDDTYNLLDANFAQGATRYDSVTEGAFGGNDTVLVGRATGSDGAGGLTTLTSYTLGANVENGTVVGAGAYNLTGNALNNRLTGNDDANTLIGGDGSDRLAGLGGVDTLIGGAGNDTYILADASQRFVQVGSVFQLRAVYDNVQEAADGGTDQVIVSRTTAPGFLGSDAQTLTSYTLGANIENGQVGGTEAFDLVGNGLNNMLFGNGAANVLNGGAGDDYLDGAGGLDTLLGGAGNDVYMLNDATMRMTTVFSNGQLTIQTRPSFDLVQEAADGGVDTVKVGRATVTDSSGALQVLSSYTLGTNVENGVVSDASEFNLNGNALNNNLFGNAMRNTLSGQGGDDTLTGGGGVDTFAYLSAGFGADSITDFRAGTGTGHDVLAINHLFAADFNAAMSDFAQVGDDAVMNLGGTGSIELHNVQMSALTASNFQFI